MNKKSKVDRLNRNYGSNEATSPCMATMAACAEFECKKFKMEVFSLPTGGIKVAENIISDELVVGTVGTFQISAIGFDEIYSLALAARPKIEKSLAFPRALGVRIFYLSGLFTKRQSERLNKSWLYPVDHSLCVLN